VQGQGGSRQHVIVHHRGRREARLARGGIREHEVLLGRDMRGPAGTGRGVVSIADRSRRREGRSWGDGPSLAITAMFF